MRPRIPPLLPTYLLLVLVVVFTVGSLWVGLHQLETIERLAESRAESAATVQELQSLRGTVVDIVTSAQGYARTGLSENIDLFERARRTVPTQLTHLRDRMRDTPSELALVERLVPLIARTAALAGAAVDRAREAPATEAMEHPPAYRESVDAIGGIIANLEAREEDEVASDGRALTAALSSARILQYLLAALIVMLVALLFMAGRRLSAFIPPIPRADAASALIDAESPAPSRARIAMLLDDVLARARLAAEALARDDPAARENLLSSIEAIERAPLSIHEEPRPGAATVVDGLALLARAYSQPGGLTIEPTLDRSVDVTGREKTYVVDRVASWGLEVVSVRKRRGDVTLAFGATEGDVSLRILALLDPPDTPLRLSPREREEADFLQRAAASLGGRLVVTHGTTGFALVLTVPVED